MGITILDALKKLENYLLNEKFSGLDPYDALSSPIFKLPIFKSNKLIRFLFQQFVKRFPINLRKIFGIKKEVNPVTLGLAIQAYSYLSENENFNKTHCLKQIDKLLIELKSLESGNSNEEYSGICWGYNFDWEARHTHINAYQPTVVATGIISNALFECWKITGNETCKDLVISCSEFVLKDLNRSYEGTNFCFSYSPFDTEKVLNASMKGNRILAQTYVFTRDEKLKEEILNSVAFVLSKQQKDGSFTYSNKRKNIDNYHTAYILDCLDEIQKCLKINTFDKELELGFNYYLTNFFTKKNEVKFYNDSLYPIDCTAGGQSLLTLVRFNHLEQANKVANNLNQNMQAKNGFFFFRKYYLWTNKTSFMRWSNAWMFVSLSYLLYKEKAK